MRATGVVEIDHQDGWMTLLVVAGGARHHSGRLSLSLEAEAAPGDPEPYPKTVLLGMLDLDCAEAPEAGQSWEIEDDIAAHAPRSGLPRAHAYFGFHAHQVKATLTLLDVASDAISVHLHFVTEDVNYYDDRARPTTTTATARLPICEEVDLWDP